LRKKDPGYVLEILQNEFIARKQCEQDWQHKLNVTLRRVRAIIVAVEKQQLFNIVNKQDKTCQAKHNNVVYVIFLYYIRRATCFDSPESSSGPQMSDSYNKWDNAPTPTPPLDLLSPTHV
jgi:ribosomal protein S24E